MNVAIPSEMLNLDMISQLIRISENMKSDKNFNFMEAMPKEIIKYIHSFGMYNPVNVRTICKQLLEEMTQDVDMVELKENFIKEMNQEADNMLSVIINQRSNMNKRIDDAIEKASEENKTNLLHIKSSMNFGFTLEPLFDVIKFKVYKKMQYKVKLFYRAMTDFDYLMQKFGLPLPTAKKIYTKFCNSKLLTDTEPYLLSSALSAYSGFNSTKYDAWFLYIATNNLIQLTTLKPDIIEKNEDTKERLVALKKLLEKAKKSVHLDE